MFISTRTYMYIHTIGVWHTSKNILDGSTKVYSSDVCEKYIYVYFDTYMHVYTCNVHSKCIRKYPTRIHGSIFIRCMWKVHLCSFRYVHACIYMQCTFEVHQKISYMDPRKYIHPMYIYVYFDTYMHVYTYNKHSTCIEKYPKLIHENMFVRCAWKYIYVYFDTYLHVYTHNIHTIYMGMYK